MTLPSQYTGDLGANSLTTSGDAQYAVWYTLEGELRVGVRDRSTERWGVDHQEHQISGAARTALALPVEADDHNYATIVQGTTGHLWIFANMHCHPLRCIRSVNPHDITAWQPASLPTTAATLLFTYPMACTLPDGTVLLYLRAGRDLVTRWGAGRSNSYLWVLDPGATTWRGPLFTWQGIDLPGGGSSAAVDDGTNFNAYPTQFVCDADGKVHVGWGWRQYAAPASPLPERTNLYPSYAYTYDGESWFAVDGTPLTLPITPFNNPACQTGFTAQGGVGYLNWGGIGVDPATGHPHMAISSSPWHHIYWDGSVWHQDLIGGGLAGKTFTNQLTPIWVNGAMYYWGPCGSNERHMRLYRADGTGSVRLGGRVPAGGVWEASPDWNAYRDHGTVEVLVPDGNTPKVYSYGSGVRIVAV